ncbi:MAG: Uma2 family endonuclease [Kofleriaceae bacterium]
MVDVARRRVSYAEYVAIANDAGVKYEYVEGEIHAMAGGSVAHARLIARITGILDRALEGRPCIVMPSDMRVRIRAADRATYPDLFVVCGDIQRDPDDDHAVINPSVIVEVLSDSTSDTDRTDKFAAYRRLPTLQEYVLISQRERRVEVYRRDGRRWHLDEYGAGEALALEVIPSDVAVDDVYVDRLGSIV